MSTNSTTTLSYKATETGKTVFYIKNEDGTRREVDGDTFARIADSTIKGYLRELTQLRERVKELEQERNSLQVTVDDFWMNFAQVEDQLAQRDAEIADLREEISSLTPNAILECEIVELRRELTRMLNLTRGLFPDSTFDTARAAIAAAESKGEPS